MKNSDFVFCGDIFLTFIFLNLGAFTNVFFFVGLVCFVFFVDIRIVSNEKEFNQNKFEIFWILDFFFRGSDFRKRKMNVFF